MVTQPEYTARVHGGRRHVCKCGCFNRGNMISSERDDRLGSLEVSAVAVMGNLRSTVRLRTSKTDPVGDRGTPEVESQMSKRDRVRRKNLEMSGNVTTNCS